MQIDWEEIWNGFNKWMCSQSCIPDVRKWDFQNSQEAKLVIEQLVEEQLKEKPQEAKCLI